mmetsp:Transcript_69247/g.166050  ORF Transcript_69247/g.166050 Transcript_69247/m.166050 type:complete len:421 (-) Transcript_69247:70-1332(-)
MAVYINWGAGEEDATVQGAEWLKRNVIASQHGVQAEKEFFEKFKAIHIDGQNNGKKTYDYGPVFDLFCEHSEDLFAVIPNKDGETRTKEVESFFSLVLSMLPQFEDAQHLDRAVSTLCTLFSSSAEQQPELRLRLLMMLYNTFTSDLREFRYRIFKYVLDYSAKAGLFDQMLPYLEYLDAWMVDWDLSKDDKRTLFLDVSKFLRELGKRIEAFQFLKRYHFELQGADEQEVKDAKVQEATLQLVKDTLQIPSVIQFDDILALETVQALKKTKHAALVELCNVFLLGGVNDLRKFQEKNPKTFAEYDLKPEDAMAKIRLLALATAVHGKSEMSLTEVASILEESEDNVERWVVRALSEGVIDGRIDQLNNKVLVKSAFQRKFGKEEWAFLDAKLTQWTDNLQNVIKLIEEQKKNSPAVQMA